MKILVTGGTGVIGEGLIPALLARGHAVRLLSRHAEQDARQWKGVEAFPGNIADPGSLRGAADGCEGVIHVAGIVAEEPPQLTFAKVNVGGTKTILDLAQAAGVKRFVHVSSLGADRGASDYHRSKRDAEELVRKSALPWIILRPGNVYGPGDEVISTVLKLVRALPAVPIIDDGNQEFQPVWYEDLGNALAHAIEREELRGQVLEVAGPEVTTLNDLIERLGRITDRKPIRLPVPSLFASVASKLAGSLAHLPIDDNKLIMLREKNVIAEQAKNALPGLLSQPPTPLDEGLRRLVDRLPELLPEEGVGPLQHKRFWADIEGSEHTPESLMDHFRKQITQIMPIEFASEPGVPTQVEKGATMTGSLPLRGHFQVRVEVNEPRRVVFATIEGHPLAGIVEFTTATQSPFLRFAIDVFARAGNKLDYVALQTLGNAAQAVNWRSVTERMIEASGGQGEVQTEIRKLEEDEAQQIEKRVRGLVQARRREQSSSVENAAQR